MAVMSVWETCGDERAVGERALSPVADVAHEPARPVTRTDRRTMSRPSRRAVVRASVWPVPSGPATVASLPFLRASEAAS
jgi:hypothetical protein